MQFEGYLSIISAMISVIVDKVNSITQDHINVTLIITDVV